MFELSAIDAVGVDTIARAVLTVATAGEGFFEITREAARFLQQSKAQDGTLLLSSATLRRRW